MRECTGSRAHGLHKLSWRLVLGTKAVPLDEGAGAQ